jgi:N-acetylmuramoyl-L-alanine amidase
MKRFLVTLALVTATFLTAAEVEKTKPVICIDPGHPSEVASGTNIQNGTSETHIDWVVALKLQKILEAKGYKGVMTKSDEDQLVTNKERAMIANRAKAAMCVRLHCDVTPHSGFAVFYPDRQGTTQGKTGPTDEIRQSSKRAAESIHAGMIKVLGTTLKDCGLRGESISKIGAQQGAFTGSIFSEVPVVLVEMVVLSNKGDAEFIKAEKNQQQMAEAIAEGVMGFVKLK